MTRKERNKLERAMNMLTNKFYLGAMYRDGLGVLYQLIKDYDDKQVRCEQEQMEIEFKCGGGG